MTNPDRVIANLKEEVETILTNRPRPIGWTDPLVEHINSEAFVELLEMIDEAVAEMTGSAFHTPDTAVALLQTLADVRDYILRAVGARMASV